MQSALGQDAPVLSHSCLGNMSHSGSGGGQGAWPRVRGMFLTATWRGKLPLCSSAEEGEMCCSEPVITVEILEELET